MNKNDFINLKFFSSIYLKLNENKMKSLEFKIKELKKSIETENKLSEQHNEYFNKLIEENLSIKNQLNNLTRLFENENKTLSLRNNNYNISIWENLYIVKKSSYYAIQSKKEKEDIYNFNTNMNDFVDYILTLDYSIIVLSISKKRITLQLRINKKLT